MEDPALIGQWIQNAAWFVALIVGVLVIVRHFKPHPPEHVTALENLRQTMEREDNKLHGRISGLRDEIKGTLDHIDARSEARMTQMQTTFVEIGESIGAVKTSVEHLTRAYDRAENRIDRLSERKPTSTQI